MTDQWIVIDAFPDEIRALLAKGQLEDAGIPSRVTMNNQGDALLAGVGMLTGPRNLLVRAAEAERARAILKTA